MLLLKLVSYKYGSLVYNNRTQKMEKMLSKLQQGQQLFKVTKSPQKLLAYYERDPVKVANYKKKLSCYC